MDNNLPDFIPKTPGDSPLVDLSHTLAAPAVDGIVHVANSCSFKPGILILPSDYNCPDVHQLALNLAQTRNTGTGRTLLMVVDLHGHKVRIIGSPELNANGITSGYITQTLVPTNFVPYMKAGDLGSAVRLTLLGINNQIATASSATTATIAQPASGMSLAQPASGMSLLQDVPWGGIFDVIFGVAIFAAAIAFYSKKKSDKERFSRLRNQIDSLHKKADQLGQASDYLDAAKNEDLARKIADFFAQLSTLDTAYDQTEKLVHHPFKTGQAAQAISNCASYVEVLTTSAGKLLLQTNQKTGVVASYEPDGRISATSEAAVRKSEPRKIQSESVSAGGDRIKLPASAAYRTPSWMADPTYSTITTNSDDGLGRATAAEAGPTAVRRRLTAARHHPTVARHRLTAARPATAAAVGSLVAI